MKKIVLLFLILGVTVSLIGCGETVSGLGKDVNRMGDLEELIVAGPFWYVRNPIYIFNIIMYCGAALLM